MHTGLKATALIVLLVVGVPFSASAVERIWDN